MTDTLDLVKLRCQISDCRTVRIPAGTSMTACLGVDGTAAIVNGETCKAGRWFVMTDVVGILLNDISVTSGAKTSAVEGILLVNAPKINLPKVETSKGVFTAGDVVYWDNTASIHECYNNIGGSGTGTSGSLSIIGYALNAVPSGATTVDICLTTDRLDLADQDAADITTIDA